MTMGLGCPLSSLTKQKLNTRSSTESEVVGVDDLMPAILWTGNFLQAQGYGVKECTVFQDYKSAILLEKNGKASSSMWTKHISIRCFFVTNRIKKGELSMEWCPTDDMLGDFWTKPTQGKQFTRVRDQIRTCTNAVWTTGVCWTEWNIQSQVTKSHTPVLRKWLAEQQPTVGPAHFQWTI
jgi:hypothetical protein